MWITLSIVSALLLGCYDVAKKQSLKKNDVLAVLLVSTAISTLFLSPWLILRRAPLSDHLFLMAKAVLVSASWISGLWGMKLLPITTASTMKASRPAFVVVLSVLLFGEQLSIGQWTGVLLIISAMFMITRSSSREGISIRNNKGFLAMGISILTGVASALYDKYIMRSMDPMFVQSWTNFYITIVMAAVLAFSTEALGNKERKLKWDWMLVVIAILITGADACYFIALSQDGAMLSVISLLRRNSVIVTFLLGALIFKEKRLREKGFWLLVTLVGMGLLVL